MFHKSPVLIVLVGTILAGLNFRPAARADDPPDGPKRIFKDEFIDNLSGEWKLTRKIRGKDGKRQLFAEDTLRRP